MKRFKKLLPIVATLALVATLVVPMTALAAALTSVSDTLTDYTESAAPEHTIAFTTIGPIEIGEFIIITFPSGFDISSIVDADVDETLTAGEATWEISSQVLTGTIITAQVTAGAQSIVIGDVGGGLNEITNPSIAGTYTISIATTDDTGTCDVNITETGTTVVTGNLPNVIEVAAPAGFTMPSLDPSPSQPITSPSKDIVVSANGTSTWTLQAHEAGGDGKMACTSPGAATLAAAMHVDASADGGVDLTLSGTAGTLASAQGAASDTISVYFEQTLAYTDTVGSDYSITVTFTVGFDA